MPDLVYFQNAQRPILPSIDLNVFEKVATGLEQGHREALQAESALRAAIAKLPMDASEDEYKVQLGNQIEQASENAALYGNKYYSIPELIKAQGDIESNPGILGRIRANEAHLKNDAAIDARTDINQDTKERFKAINPYHYEDKYDSKGNVIGGTEWTPKYTPVKDISLIELFEAAGKFINPDTTSWDNITFVNSDGTETATMTPNSIYQKSSSGTLTRVTPEDVRAAIDAVLNSNPAYRAGILQGYETELWKKEANKYSDEDIAAGVSHAFNKDGTAKGFNRYLDEIIEPLATQMAYNRLTNVNNSLTVIKPSSTNRGGLFGVLNGRGNNNINDFYEQLKSTNGYSIEIDPSKNEVYSVRDAQIAGSQMAAIYGEKYGILKELSAGPLGFETDYSTIANLIRNSSAASNNDIQVDLAEIRAVCDRFDSYWEELKKTINTNDASYGETATLLLSAVNAGQDISKFADSENKELSKASKRHGRSINRIFGKNGSDITISADSKDIVNGILSGLNISFDDKEILSNYGITIANNGKDIIFDKDYARNLPNLAHAIAGYKDKIKIKHKTTGFTFNNELNASPFISGGFGTIIGGVPGGVLGMAGGIVSDFVTNKERTLSTDAFLSEATRIERDIQGLYEKEFGKGVKNPETILFSTDTRPYVSTLDALSSSAFLATGESEYKSVSDEEKRRTLNSIGNNGIINKKLYILDKNTGIFKDVDTVYGLDADNQRRLYNTYLQNAINTNKFDINKDVSKLTLPNGEQMYQITIFTGETTKTKDEKNNTTVTSSTNDYIVIATPDNIGGDPYFDSINDSNSTKLLTDMYASLVNKQGRVQSSLKTKDMAFSYGYEGYKDSQGQPLMTYRLNGVPKVNVAIQDAVEIQRFNNYISNLIGEVYKERKNLYNKNYTPKELNSIMSDTVLSVIQNETDIDLNSIANVFHSMGIIDVKSFLKDVIEYTYFAN